MWFGFHFHKWIYTEAVYESDCAEKIGFTNKPATRTCVICNKQEYQEKHCLGLNPPKYISHWFKVEKLDG